MHLSFTLLGLFVASALSAQVTITHGMLDQGGTGSTMHLVTDMGSATTPSDGANQTWDYSSVTLQALGTMAFIPAAGTPHAASYPGANWAFEQTVTGLGTDYSYLTINTSNIIMVADEVPSDPNAYSDTKHIMQFPLSFGNTFTDTWADTEGSGTVLWAYSGHGTMITPLGTFTNIVKVVSNEGDMILWNTSPLCPLVIADGSSILFFAPEATSVNELQSEPLELLPNPCHDRLTLRHAKAGEAWSILDAQGRQVRSGLTSSGDVVIDVQELGSGTYVMQVQQASGRRMSAFVKQ